MATITVNDNQLRLIQKALDFYSRIGIGQFGEIKDHPTFQNHLYNEFAKKGPLEVGDESQRGTVVEIGEGYIKTEGTWGKGKEIKTWHDVESIKHTTDYSKYHEARDAIDITLVQPRNMLIRDPTMLQRGSWGIHNPDVDESCREAFDIIQVIRHEYWKIEPNRSTSTVDSSIHLTTKDSENIKVKL